MEQWKSALLTLPDEVFFDIMRNYLGELRTPFNKHTLIEELSTFLRRNETQERILEHIDDADAEVLTAVHLLDRPTVGSLFTFFEGSMSYLELHYLLLNLQERLLIFVDNMEGHQRLHLNPFLSRLLRSRVVDAGRLFPSESCDLGSVSAPWPTEALILALYSHLSAAPDLLKADGAIKKRAFEEIESVFPELGAGKDKTHRVRLVLSALIRLGLVTDNRGVVRPDYSRWRAFVRPDARSRRILFWTALLQAIATDEAAATDASPQSVRAMEEDARVLLGFLTNLPTGRAFGKLALSRLLGVFGSLHAFPPERSGRAPDKKHNVQDKLVYALVQLGLLFPVSPDGESEKERYAVNPYLSAAAPPEPRSVMIEPDFQLTMKPTVEFGDGIVVAMMAEIRRYDVYPRYEITKRSFVRALEQDYTSNELVDLLERLGESKLPQNVRFSLSNWEKEYRGLALFRGIVLTADTERRHLIEHSEAMKPWILRTLAPGVYLLDDRNVVEWTRALKRSGIDPIPPVQETAAIRSDDHSGPVFHSLGHPPSFHREEHGHSRAKNQTGGERSNRKGELVTSLLATLQKLELSPETSSELAARINKKLILFPRQLEQAQTKQDKNEAKGLDYVGKVRLVEQALRSGSDLLEILERTSNGTTRRLLVHPSEVRKSGNDLMLYGKTLPDNENVQIKVRKIGLVRKLKSSLYAP